MNILNCTFGDFLNHLKRWKKMTDENLHSELRMEIASFFMFPDYTDYFFSLTKKEYLSMEELEERERKTNKMFEDVLKKYDYEKLVPVMVERIKDCL